MQWEEGTMAPAAADLAPLVRVVAAACWMRARLGVGHRRRRRRRRAGGVLRRDGAPAAAGLAPLVRVVAAARWRRARLGVRHRRRRRRRAGGVLRRGGRVVRRSRTLRWTQRRVIRGRRCVLWGARRGVIRRDGAAAAPGRALRRVLRRSRTP